MTRTLASHRLSRPVLRVRMPRLPGIVRLGFTCFRLELAGSNDPDEPAFVPVQLVQTRNAMGAFLLAVG